MTVLKPDEIERHRVVRRDYEDAQHSGLVREHCQIQLARYYFEHSDRALAMNYFGVSKLCCAALLKLEKGNMSSP